MTTKPDPSALDSKDLLVKWDEAKKAMAAWKAIEGPLREEVLKRFADANKKDGTQNVSVAEHDAGFGILTVTKTCKYELANKEQETQQLVANPENGIPANLISWDAKLNVKEWKKIVAEAEKGTRGFVGLKRRIEDVLTVKPQSPQVKTK